MAALVWLSARTLRWEPEYGMGPQAMSLEIVGRSPHGARCVGSVSHFVDDAGAHRHAEVAVVVPVGQGLTAQEDAIVVQCEEFVHARHLGGQ